MCKLHNIIYLWCFSYLWINIQAHLKDKTAISLEFDHVESDNNVACYYYQVKGYKVNDWQTITIYTNPDKDADEIYTSITNALYRHIEIRPAIFEYNAVISQQYGAGISISKRRRQRNNVYHNNQIFFCIDDIVDDTHDNGAYCIDDKHSKKKKKKGTHVGVTECRFMVTVPDFDLAASEPTSIPTNGPTQSPTSEPTSIPTNEPTIDLEGEVLIPGESYSFPGGTFTLSNDTVIVRPNMIYDCSAGSEYVYLYSAQLNDMEINVGNPLFSLTIDLYEMPTTCPVLFGTIKTITQISSNIIKIELEDLSLTQLFQDADLNLENMPVIDIGYSIIPNDSYIDDDNNTDIYAINNGSYFINDTALYNDTTSLTQRRRLWEISPEIVFPSFTLDIPINRFFTITFTKETKFNIHIILEMSWWRVNRFKFEWGRTSTNSITLTASLKIEKEIEFAIPGTSVTGKTFVVSIWGIPVTLTPFQKLKIGFSAAAEVKSECKLSLSLVNKRGFDYTRGIGLKLIWLWKPQFDASCDLLDGRKCELTFRIWIAVIRGVKIYHGIISAALEQRYGPQLQFTYPTQLCTCSKKQSEITLAWVEEKFYSITLFDHWLFRAALGLRKKKWKTPSVKKTNSIKHGICINVPDLPDPLETALDFLCCAPPPTASPTLATTNPTLSPTAPTTDPTSSPSTDPTRSPTTDPTLSPTSDPTKNPTSIPSKVFSANIVDSFHVDTNVLIDQDQRRRYIWIGFVTGVFITSCIVLIIMLGFNKCALKNKIKYDPVSESN